MGGIIIIIVVALAVITLIALGVYEYGKLEREKTEKRLERQGEIILNVLSALRETYGETFKNSSLVYGYNLEPWKDEKSGTEVSGIGALVSDINQIQVQVAVISGMKQYAVFSEGNQLYQNFFVKTNEGGVSEKGLIDVVEKHYGQAINTDRYHQVEVEKDEDEKPIIYPPNFFESNRW